MKNQLLIAKEILIIASIIIIVVLQKPLWGQSVDENMSDKKDFKSHLFYGGGFGLQFGTVTLVEVSPMIGYKITPKLGVGVSPTYKYYRVKDYYSTSTSTDLVTNVYGGSIFARYSIFENIFAHVEYESLFYNTKVPGYASELQQFNSFLVGGGYRQQIGGNSAMNLMLLWNLNDTQNSLYTNPIIRVGFSIGM